MGGESPELGRVVDGIRRYVRIHPQVRDSLIGIQRWWLEREGIAVTLDVVEDALDFLLARGELSVRTSLDGTVVYFATSGGDF